MAISDPNGTASATSSPTRKDRAAKYPLVSLADIEAAAERIKGRVRQTPLLTNETIDGIVSEAVGAQVQLAFKAEHLQVVGAFKSRGAANAIQVKLAQLRASNPSFDPSKLCVLTHSSGNHGAALACQAKVAGVQAAIVMPRTAPQVKKDNVTSYGARVWFCEPRQEARDQMAAEVRAKLEKDEGLVVEFIHPYDDDAIIAGQGTMGREMMLQAGGLADDPMASGSDGHTRWTRRSPTDDVPFDIVIAPVGGGGMLSGVSSAVKLINGGVVVIGAEPAAADDAHHSLKTGSLHPAIAPPRTICDGLLTSLSERTLAHIEERVDDIALASDAAVVQALALVLQHMKQLIEPSSAVGLAALLENEEVKKNVRKVAEKRAAASQEGDRSVRIGLVWSGGNVTVETLAELIKGSGGAGH